ncbi:MAG TPA: transposase [bacterium]|nr:transposase [bacterium]HQL60922.1 transposase [bacterium]
MCQTIRLKLFKLGARIRVTVRRIVVSMASGCPYQALFAGAYANLNLLRPFVLLPGFGRRPTPFY